MARPIMTVDYRGRVYYRSKTHKRIFMSMMYSASHKLLAKRYGWRKVREVIKGIQVC